MKISKSEQNLIYGHASLCEICGASTGSAAGFPPSTSVLPCQKLTANDPYLLVLLPPMQQNPRNLKASLTDKINKTFHKHMSTKSEYYMLLLHHLLSDDGSIAATKLHEYLNKFKILHPKKKKKLTYNL